ncbi:hypothetical protein AYO20_10768 [Fonsecaea nubica]|uniref:Methyltransferase domain-containing protein n=1 Tax=Fonsecaea nubica TaxID=856822 RepID=A0A178C4Z3_9EURO|nr:hypothetical protein AYO20_10768 [Fonsecaea nubica]OAL24023.1 hypothetical protein AYO20_10768 [Fonsecaea nubica]
MAQNMYDNPAFFNEYRQLPRSVHGLDGAPEWPTLRRLVGDIQGARVLDLGCGFGWFCRWAVKEAAARSAHGVDISENMLRRAREMPAAEEEKSLITYERSDLEQGLELAPGSYDFVYSSLALHYLPTDALRRLLAQVFACLDNTSTIAPGRFVFSVEHPVLTAPADASWRRDEQGRVFWPLNRYWDEGLRVTDWLADGVRKYHRTVETYVSLLLEAGFVLESLKESWDGLDLRTKVDEGGEAHRPYFLLVAVSKPVFPVVES